MPNQDLINKIIDQVNIAEVIGEYIPVLPDGSGFKSVCPFHNDTHPSMKISTSKKIFKCFSCGEGGNVIQFVQKYEKISFSEALSKLAKRIGIDYNFNPDPNYEAKKKLFDCLKESAEFYQFYLLNSEEGKLALEYLNKRGISEELIQKFGIGLAPSENDYLHQALDNKGLPLIDQVESGMVRENKGVIIDTFRSRIMFPLTDLNGNIAGFSGRIYLENDHGPKYMNSNENLIFHKGDMLYNYSNASSEIRMSGDVYVFEGFMDVIAAAKASVNNAIATMGTALTKNHVKALNMVAKRIILCFDGDAAGIEATHKAARVLSDFNIIPYAVSLPDGMDPDEYQIKYGSEELKKYLETHLINVYEYMYLISKRNLITNDVVSIQKFKEKVFDFLKYANNTIKEFYLKKLCEDTNISYDNLIKELNYLSKYDSKPKEKEQPISTTTKIKKENKIPKKIYNALGIIIYHSIYSKDDFRLFFAEYLHKLHPVDFIDYIAILFYIAGIYQSDENLKEIDPNVLKSNLFEESQEYKILDKIISSNIFDKDNHKEFLDSIKTIDDYLLKVKSNEKYNQCLNDDNSIKEYIELLKENTTIMK